MFGKYCPRRSASRSSVTFFRSDQVLPPSVDAKW